MRENIYQNIDQPLNNPLDVTPNRLLKRPSPDSSFDTHPRYYYSISRQFNCLSGSKISPPSDHHYSYPNTHCHSHCYQ